MPVSGNASLLCLRLFVCTSLHQWSMNFIKLIAEDQHQHHYSCLIGLIELQNIMCFRVILWTWIPHGKLHHTHPSQSQIKLWAHQLTSESWEVDKVKWLSWHKLELSCVAALKHQHGSSDSTNQSIMSFIMLCLFDSIDSWICNLIWSESGIQTTTKTTNNEWTSVEWNKWLNE